MITEFNTKVVAPKGGAKGGGGAVKTIVGLLVVAGIAYAGYRFWWKPKQESKNRENEFE